MQRIKDIICNKNIAIVGNADSVMDYNNGLAIDSADVVIRMNCGYPKKENSIHIGKRTDIAMIAGGFTTFEGGVKFSELRKFKYKYVVSLDRNPVNDRYKNYIRYPQEWADEATFNVYGQTVNGHPHASTGLNAIHMAIKCNAKSVAIYGFDFYKTNDWAFKSIYGKVSPAHDFNKEEPYVRSLGIKIVEDNMEAPNTKQIKNLKRKRQPDIDHNKREYESICHICGYKSPGKRTRCLNCNTEINTVY